MCFFFERERLCAFVTKVEQMETVKVTYKVIIKYCVFFSRIFNILRSLSRPHWATIGCTENGQPIRVTLHPDLLHMQGMGCSEFEKTIFNEH